MSVALVRAPITPAGWKRGEQPPGTWYPYPLGPHPMPGERMHEGRRVMVYVCCPECRRIQTLSSRVHRIADTGEVRPSLVCPHDGCAWHVFVRLDGWSGPAAAAGVAR